MKIINIGILAHVDAGRRYHSERNVDFADDYCGNTSEECVLIRRQAGN